MQQLAVYAGTFDPITYGHIDIVERASRLFDQVIVAIAASPNKRPLFSLAERIDLATQVLKNYTNVTVQGFETLLIDFVKQQNATIIVRGLRAVADFDYEFQLASMNRFIFPAVETVFLMPSEKYLYFSASIVREIALLKGDVAGFVPSSVVNALIKKIPS